MAKLHWKEVESLAKAHHLEKSTSSLDSLSRALQWWWCQKFNRPLKDPLLQQYTLDELLYEFLRYYYAQPENDPRKEVDQQVSLKEEDEWLQKQMQQIKAKQDGGLKPLTVGLDNLSKATEAPSVSTQEPSVSTQEPSVATQAEAQIPNLPDISTKFDE